MAFVNALDPAVPAGGEAASLGDDRIREFKAAMIERVQSFFSNVDNDPWQVKSGVTFLGSFTQSAGTAALQAVTATTIAATTSATVTATSGNLLKLAYDASNHIAWTVGSTGIVSMTITGAGGQLNLNKTLSVTGGVTATGDITSGGNVGDAFAFSFWQITSGGVATFKRVIVSQGTVSPSVPAISASATWNAAGTKFQALLIDVTNTASSASSRVIELIVSTAVVWFVSPTGATTQAQTLTVTAGGLTVSAGTTAVQALTATTGVFSSTVTASSFGGVVMSAGAVSSVTTFTASGAGTFTGTTESSSSTTGILQVSGGIGVAKSIYGTASSIFQAGNIIAKSALLINAASQLVMVHNGASSGRFYSYGADNATPGALILTVRSANSSIDLDVLTCSTGGVDLNALPLAGITSLAGNAAVSGFTSATFSSFVQGSEHRVAGTKVVGAQGAAVADAAGGAVIDAEARTALNTLLARVRAHGLIA